VVIFWFWFVSTLLGGWVLTDATIDQADDVRGRQNLRAVADIFSELRPIQPTVSFRG
jgi:hypothetical protein